MAYLTRLRPLICEWGGPLHLCRYRAIAEARSTKNELLGKFCKRHAEVRLTRQREREGERHYCAVCGRDVDLHL